MNNSIEYLYPDCRHRDIPYIFTKNARIFYFGVSISTVAMALVAVSLNSLFLVTMFVNWRLQTTSKQILMLLACSDLLNDIVICPIYAFHMLEKYHGRVLCQMHNICNIFGLALGVLIVTTIFTTILEQYLAILHPFWYERHINTLRMIIPNIAVFILTTATVAIGRYLLSRKGYLVIRVLQFNFTGILLLLIIYLYINVIKIARKTQRRIGNVINSSVKWFDAWRGK